jgi:(R,R)-butanediol dehydrogenase/meso-butanediol dehydrogenase/diacetyl reductase
MLAAMYYGRGDVRMESVLEPPVPDPGEVGLEVLYAAICRADGSMSTHGPLLIPLHSRHHARRSLERKRKEDRT